MFSVRSVLRCYKQESYGGDALVKNLEAEARGEFRKPRIREVSAVGSRY
jgi:hypothetical protein